MSRLPSRPVLDWREDGTPVGRDHDDVYFSAHNGLEETRTVFLQGCNLPEAWIGKDAYTIGELGFGTGLNFLAVWELWRRFRPSATAWLHFASFEGFPLSREDARRALARWPELDSLTERLLSKWPDRLCGVQRLSWPDEGISLTLHVDDISSALQQSVFSADAWFLDGFSPAKNSDMWSEGIYPLLAERSNAGASIGTYTVAGHVRQGLASAGFTVSKQPGFARKRERLEALYEGTPKAKPDVHGVRSASKLPKSVAVIGGGIGGASIANALAKFDINVTLYDEADHLGSGASGNPMALVKPRLDASDTVVGRLMLESYIYARRSYSGLLGVSRVDASHPPASEAEQERFLKIKADMPLEESLLSIEEDGTLIHRDAIMLHPNEVLKALAASADLRLGRPVTVDVRNRVVNDEDYDAIILATGSAIASHQETGWLDIRKKAGQVDFLIKAVAAAPYAVSSGRYVMANGTLRLAGANFEACETAPPASSDVRADNLAAVASLAPHLLEDFETEHLKSRVSIRATTADSLPFAGAIPDYEEALELFSGVRQGRMPDQDAPLIDGAYVLSGLGARGFTFAPLMAEYLASQLVGAPSPLSNLAMAAVSPMRQILRDLKRGKI